MDSCYNFYDRPCRLSDYSLMHFALIKIIRNSENRCYIYDHYLQNLKDAEKKKSKFATSFSKLHKRLHKKKLKRVIG